MKVETVLGINNYQKEPKLLLDEWLNEYNKHKDNPLTSQLIERINKAYNYYVSKESYDESEFDGDFILGSAENMFFASKYFPIKDIVRLQLNMLDEVLQENNISYDDISLIRKGIIYELKNDFYSADEYFSLVNDNEMQLHGSIIRNKEDIELLIKDLKQNCHCVLHDLEKERLLPSDKDFWTCALTTGYEIKKDVQKRHLLQFNFRRLAADYGDPFSMYVLSIAYVRGYPVNQDPEKAFYYAHKARLKKEYMASFVEGMLYEDGFGCEKDINKAIEAYKEASEHNVIGAMLRLSLIYKYGKDGISPDEALSKTFFNKVNK